MTPRIFWIGDSTVQFNNISTWPQCGMGQVLDLYVRPGIAVYDHARNGRSTKSFYDEGLWAPVEAALCPGDLLLMQFGHNDEKSEDPTRYAAPDQFAANLLAYAHAAQAKGALPCSSRRWCAAALRGALWFRPTVLTPTLCACWPRARTCR